MYRAHRIPGKSRIERFLASLAVLLFANLLMVSAASASGSKYVLTDDEDGSPTANGGGFTNGGFSNSVTFDLTLSTPVLKGPPIGESARWVAAAAGGTATATWNLGLLASATPGAYSFEAYIPDDDTSNGQGLTYLLQKGSSNTCSTATYTTATTWSGISQNNRDGNWIRLGTYELDGLVCWRVVLSNASAVSTDRVWADAVRVQREYESAFTIPDMPNAESTLAAGTNFINSASNAAPTVLTSQVYTCPRNGVVTVSASGESAAVSTAGGAFIGLAYSISKDSLATDNSNVVQSSALSTFAGDANRDFLFAQRVDACTAGQSVTYRLTGYATSAQTKISGGAGQSFMWNPRLTVQYTPY